MKTLGEYPALRLLAAGQALPDDRAGFAGARTVPVNAPGALAEAVRNSGASRVVVIDAHATPSPEAEALVLHTALLDTGLCLSFPTRSVVTGLTVRRGLRLIPTAQLKDPSALPKPALTLPHLAGVFSANDSPQRAFRTAYELTAETTHPSEPRKGEAHALAASLGAEAMNGLWWSLGALAAISGAAPVEHAWSEDAPLLASPSELPRRHRARARQVRVETGVPVHAFDAQQSRAIKALLPDVSAEDIWRDFIAGLADIGADGLVLSAQYAKAVSFIWPSGAAEHQRHWAHRA